MSLPWSTVRRRRSGRTTTSRCFSRQRDDLRSAAGYGRAICAEINLSAKQLRDNRFILGGRLLGAFGFPANVLALYLREDRDAGCGLGVCRWGTPDLTGSRTCALGPRSWNFATSGTNQP